MNTPSLFVSPTVSQLSTSPLPAASTNSSVQGPVIITSKSSRYVGHDRPLDFMYFSSLSKLTTDQNPVDKKEKKYINSDILRHDQNVKIYQEITYVSKDGKPIGATNNEFIIETTNQDDKVIIKKGPDNSLIAIINNTTYQLNLLHSPDGSATQPLRIRTNGGNDCVLIDPLVDNDIYVELGDGDDYAQAGSGNTWLYGGAGNDYLKLGSGNGVAFGGDGDDLLIAGSGNSILKGNNGNDRMQAGKGSPERHLFMDGGDGHDFMIVTRNDTDIPAVIHGGKGENLIVTHGPATVYTGRDKNIVRSDNDDTVIYAKPSDQIHRTPGSTLVHTQPSEAGKSGYIVEGSTEFKQQVEDDMELLSMSIQGKKMLRTADATAQRNDAPVRIIEFPEDNGQYFFNSAAIRNHVAAGNTPETLTPAALGYITHNQRGAVAIGAEIHYNPSHSLVKDSVPVNVLYHEMAHAYNGATGTRLAGSTGIPENPGGEPNDERQAVGLPTIALPFDFDNHRSTEPTTTNPKPFTENALREEMGRPLRTRYT